MPVKSPNAYYRWVGGIVGVWFLASLLTLNYNGLFFDEGIYIAAGLRTLEGYGYSDRYLTWFGGTLLWPTLAGLGYRVAGTVGARALALLAVSSGLLAFAYAARNLFGERAGFWATVALALNGALISMARLAVYDGLAWAGMAISFWAFTELARQDHRKWLFLAVAAYVVGTLAKYPTGVMLLPLLGILVLTRRRKAALDLLLFGYLGALVALMVLLPVREQVAIYFQWRLTNTPSFGVTLPMIAWTALSLSLPALALAPIGWAMRRENRLLSSVLLISLFLWPAYHLLRHDPVSITKHLTFGYLFAYPLVGVALATLWDAGKGAIRALCRVGAALLVVALAALGISQALRADRGWPDLRPPAQYLMEHVRPGEKLLINESWPLIAYLYAEGRIASPWDVYDTYRVTQGELETDLCAVDWFVDVRGSFTWPEEILKQIRACGTFQPLLSSTSWVVNIGSDLRYVEYPVETVIWRNYK